MSEIKLSPCPFCGAEAHIETHKFYEEKTKDFTSKTYGVICDNCHTSGRQFYESEAEAIEAWNIRKPMDKIVERLKEESKFVLYEMNEPSIYAGVERAIEIVKGGVE